MAAEQIDHSDGKIDFRGGRGDEGRGGSLQRPRELAWCQGLGSVTGSGLLIQRCSLLFIYPGGAACLDSLPEEFTLTTASLGDTARHKLFFGHFFLFKADK